MGNIRLLQFQSPLSPSLPYGIEELQNYVVTTQNSSVTVNLSDFSVPCGGVKFSLQLVEENSQDNQTAVASLGITSNSDGNGTVTITGLNLRNGGVYRVLVTASNVRSDSQRAKSDPILVDFTPPIFTGKILDGHPSVDVQYQKSDSVLFAYWNADDFSDPESGCDMSSLAIGVGTSPLFTDVRDFAPAESDHGFAKYLKLVHNRRYYVSVSIANRVGLRRVVASDGVLVDVSPPVAGSVTFQDSLSRPTYYLSDCGSRVVAHVVDFIDAESGIDLFQWKLCKRPIDDPLTISCSRLRSSNFSCAQHNCTLNVRLPINDMITDSCFMHGYVYQLHVSARNRAGSYIEQVSNDLVVDFYPPIKGQILDGPTTADIDYQSDRRKLSASWTAFRDSASGIGTCRLTGIEEYGTVNQIAVTNNETVPTSGNWTSDQLALSTGKRYYVRIICVDKAGNAIEAASDGVLIDSVPPEVGKVTDIPVHENGNSSNEDIDYQLSTTEVKTRWEEFKSLSQTKSCMWSLSTSKDVKRLGDTVAEVEVTSPDRSYSTLTRIRPFVTYYAGVRCTSNAGLTSAVAFSDGIMADASPPIIGRVLDLHAGQESKNDIDYVSYDDALKFVWSGFSDPQSGISRYAWTYGPCGEKDGPRMFPLESSDPIVYAKGLNLTHNVTYCVTVQATNGAGANSRATSDGILVDTTAPEGGTLLDGFIHNRDIDYQLQPTVLSYRWDAFVDPESGIESLVLSVRSRPGNGETAVRKVDPTETSYMVDMLTLHPEMEYYGTICATNRAGMETCVSSDGVSIIGTFGPATSEPSTFEPATSEPSIFEPGPFESGPFDRGPFK